MSTRSQQFRRVENSYQSPCTSLSAMFTLLMKIASLVLNSNGSAQKYCLLVKKKFPKNVSRPPMNSLAFATQLGSSFRTTYRPTVGSSGLFRDGVPFFGMAGGAPGGAVREGTGSSTFPMGT